MVSSLSQICRELHAVLVVRLLSSHMSGKSNQNATVYALWLLDLGGEPSSGLAGRSLSHAPRAPACESVFVAHSAYLCSREYLHDQQQVAHPDIDE